MIPFSHGLTTGANEPRLFLDGFLRTPFLPPLLFGGGRKRTSQADATDQFGWDTLSSNQLEDAILRRIGLTSQD